MAVPPTIRDSHRREARRLAEIYVETWRTTYAGMVPDSVLLNMSVDTQAVRWARYLERRSADEVILTAEADGVGAIGFASGGPARAGRGRRIAGTGEIYTLYVAPDWQGQGAGRALLDGLFERFRAAGYHRALLWVVANNPSRFFYEALGGRRTVERIERMWGVDLQEIGYEWDLEVAE